MAGETTSLPASAAFQAPKAYEAGCVAYYYTQPFSTTQNELNDVMEMGWLPPNVTVVGYLASATDMDTNVSPAAVHKITIGSTDVATGLTVAQAGTSASGAITPQVLTAKTLVKVQTTTAAATAAAGTFYLTLLCVNN